MTDIETRSEVRVITTFGDYADLATELRPAGDPLRVPAAAITADTGLGLDQLPGRRFRAIVTEDSARDFQPA